MNKLKYKNNNYYLAHGTGRGGENEDVVNSILKYGLRCKDESLYFTTCSIGVGSDILYTDENLNNFNNWPHLHSRFIVFVSVPTDYLMLPDMMGDRCNAYFVRYDINQANNFNIATGVYVMPEFIAGYFDSKTQEFVDNPNYYENLSNKVKTKLFEKIKINYYNNIVERFDNIEFYKDIIKDTGFKFALTNEDIQNIKQKIKKQKYEVLDR